MYVDLVLNLALLVAMSVVSGFVAAHWSPATRLGAIAQGALFGGTAVIGMLRPLTLGPGLFFDGRSMVLSLTAFYFGPLAALVAGAITILYRVWVGGAGAITGVLVIGSSIVIGTLFRARRRSSTAPPTVATLYAFGVAVHAAMLVMLFAMPTGEAWRILWSIGPAVMALYPLATVLAGKILSDQRMQRRAHDTLMESEQRLRLALRAANRGLYDLDLRTGEAIVSPEYAEMLGYRAATLRETHAALVERLHPDDRGRAVAAYEQCLSGHAKEYSVEFRLRAAGGHWKWILSLGSVVAGPDGRPARLVGTHTDISVRKETELELAKSVDRFQRAMRATFNAVWDLDLVTELVWWNDNFYQLFGYEPRDVVVPTQEFWSTRVHPEDRPRVEASLRAAIESDQDDWGEAYRFLRKDGRYAFVEDRASISRDERGRAVRMLGAMHDMTSRHEAESNLQLLSAALNAAANATVITDRDGVIVWANPAFTALTGYAIHEALGRTPSLLKSGLHDSSFYEELWGTLLAGHVWTGELTNRRKDGSPYLEQQTITPVKNAAGHVTHFIAIKRDLTVEREMETHLLQAQRMEAIGRLAGGIAHDFNNLLTVIIGAAELMALQISPSDPLNADVEDIRQASERAAALTRQLLAFSRKQIIKPTHLDFNSVVVNMQRMLTRVLGEDIRLVVRPSSAESGISGDAGQIEQVVMNLAINARDAMPNGGQLTFDVSQVRVDEELADTQPPLAPGAYVMLRVSDTGIGMDEETRGRMFEPFFTTKAAGQGTGLGLATVYGIVKQNGGGIRAHSEVGRGTTFEILLPRSGAAVQTPQRTTSAGPEVGHEAILVVDDEPAVCRLTTRVLQRAGYAVSAVATAEEAEAILRDRAQPLHLLLTDVVLPGMNGRELADRAAHLRPGLKVLFASGYSDDAVLRRGVVDNTADFIEKPYAVDALIRKVRERLDGD